MSMQDHHAAGVRGPDENRELWKNFIYRDATASKQG